MNKHSFKIEKPCKEIATQLQDKIDNLTKPKGSLGRLEEMAVQIGTIQQTLTPTITNPQNIIYGGDHGIAAEGISFSPPEITPQMVFNFIEGGAGINFFARQHGIGMKVVDSGINYDFEPMSELIDLKVRKGTRNYLHEAAMTEEEFNLCLERGASVIEMCHREGTNLVSFGEMGIGNTSSSSMWMACLTGIELEKCVGAGSGFDSEGVKRKYRILKAALDNYKGDGSDLDYIRYFGGYEMVMAVGGMLKAAELKMVILIDGFIMTNCILAASRICPEVLEYAIFTHQGDEAGHKMLLDFLGAKPLINFGLRLGEGSGALCAYPLIESAVRMINEMSSWQKASVTKYF
ncbi:nicotinate-nucleotide--dimethylbenzimidazole phosphoribosyltransferase [Parabacteroides sp. FAFU027]|uniref:nicotinate-nucleotide--dimethylbenzimidazole phosphoribosyltransferase n=1 Tax=Parabacteroides sp. FAFU027 TaxID=2922715 RepID=UPI001FAEDF8F|nr:nicotinate-nucleotide--dimethylbenzimidazole phosphoribosyltransferase [Parabacteroides sp. FAFU027]